MVGQGMRPQDSQEPSLHLKRLIIGLLMLAVSAILVSSLLFIPEVVIITIVVIGFAYLIGIAGHAVLDDKL